MESSNINIKLSVNKLKIIMIYDVKEYKYENEKKINIYY